MSLAVTSELFIRFKYESPNLYLADFRHHAVNNFDRDSLTHFLALVQLLYPKEGSPEQCLCILAILTLTAATWRQWIGGVALQPRVGT